MPCYDGRERESDERASRHQSAMTALLCGVMRQSTIAGTLAAEWCAFHFQIDELRKLVKYDWQDRRIGKLHENCDAVLDRAHAMLCTSDNT
jgi:hypothetical protein